MPAQESGGQQAVSQDAEEFTCWVCQEEGDSAEEGKLLHTGCGCRGSSGWVHLSCLVAAANGQTKTFEELYAAIPAVETADGQRLAHVDDFLASARSGPQPGMVWRRCPTCEQLFTGEVELGLAKARWSQMGGNTDEMRDLMWWLDEPQRIEACTFLIRAMGDSKEDCPEALVLAEQLLVIMQRMPGPNHPNTLGLYSNMAHCHKEMGNKDEAAKLLKHVLRVTRKYPNGPTSPFGPVPLEDGQTTETVAASSIGFAANNYGACLVYQMGQFASGRVLVEEGLELRRRVFGDSNEDTLASMNCYARCLADIGDYFLATHVYSKASATAHRLLGTLHPLCASIDKGWTKETKETGWPPETRAVACATVPEQAGHPPIRTMRRSEVESKLPQVAVLGLDEASGCYTCAHPGQHYFEQNKQDGGEGDSGGKDAETEGDVVVSEKSKQISEWKGLIKPSDLILNDGTAVIIQGLQAASAHDLNGRRGLVQGYDEEKGRYTVAVAGRKKPLGLRPECCRLSEAVSLPAASTIIEGAQGLTSGN